MSQSHPDAHAMTTGTDLDSVTLNPALMTTAIGVVAARTIAEVTPDHSTGLPITTSHMTGALAPTTTAATHLTTDLHLTEIPPKMTAGLNIDLGNNTINQPKDLHQLHIHHLGNLRTGDTNRSTIDDPSSEYYSSDDNDSNSDDDLN